MTQTTEINYTRRLENLGKKKFGEVREYIESWGKSSFDGRYSHVTTNAGFPFARLDANRGTIELTEIVDLFTATLIQNLARPEMSGADLI